MIQDSTIEGLVLKHDTAITTLASSIKHLAETSAHTNDKLDKVVDVLNSHNILRERINNIDDNLKESAHRTFKRLEILEKSHNGSGCGSLKTLDLRISSIEEVKSLVTKVAVTFIVGGILGAAFLVNK